MNINLEANTCDIWNAGLICAFEFARVSNQTTMKTVQMSDSHWVPIGWRRIFELANTVQIDLVENENDFIVAGAIDPNYESSEGPIWWCHLSAEDDFANAWLRNAPFLHPTISIALRDVSRPICERLKNFMYQVPIRMAGGLLFELLGKSVGFRFCNENDGAIVIRSWHTQKFLLTTLHVKGSALNIDVIGISEVQKLLLAGGSATPKSLHEVIAYLACHISRWDDRVFRISIFAPADEIELKFANRRTNEDLNPLSMIIHEEIKSLTTQVIGVKWALDARKEIIFELLQHLRGTPTKNLLEGIIKNTRKMLEELEAVRRRLFKIQHFLQNTVNAELQEKNSRVTHNMTIYGGCGLFLSLIIGLFGINLDGMPSTVKTPYAFAVFTRVFIILAIILIVFGMRHYGLKNDATVEEINATKLEHQQLISMFRHDLETHAKIKGVSMQHN